MAIKLSRGLTQLLNEANKSVDAITADEAISLHQRSGYQLIDLREPQELVEKGRIPGALNCPRGVLEFWADPESDDAIEEFQTADTLILFCAGGLRSALAARTLQEMGFKNVKHVSGGFGAWCEQGGITIALSS